MTDESTTTGNAPAPVISEATATETPTQILSVKGDRVTVSDRRGRVIIVQKLTALAWYDLSKALGTFASNPATADLGALAASVRQIDTAGFAIPSKEADVRLVLQMLDFDGLAAVNEGLRQFAAKSELELETAKN